VSVVTTRKRNKRVVGSVRKKAREQPVGQHQQAADDEQKDDDGTKPELPAGAQECKEFNQKTRHLIALVV